MLEEPLDPARAKQLIRQILSTGTVSYSSHAEDALRRRDLSTVDCVNVLRAGVVQPGEFEHGTWRYPVHTSRIVVIVAFPSATSLRIVTAWRI